MGRLTLAIATAVALALLTAVALALPATGAAAASRTVSFYGRVVRAGQQGLVLQEAGGRRVSFSAGEVASVQGLLAAHGYLAHTAGDRAASIDLGALQPGVTVLVTEALNFGAGPRVTVTLPSAAAPGIGVEQQAAGVIRDLGQDNFLLEDASGLQLLLHLRYGTPQSLGLQVCSRARVSYHQGAGELLADRVIRDGASSANMCGDYVPSETVTGTITSVSVSRLRVRARGGRARSFTVHAPGLTASFSRGDYVQVTYSASTSGPPLASDVEYVERTATGTVTGVASGRLAIRRGDASKVFTADPAAGMFEGLALGETVSVTYHQSWRRLVAEVAAPAAGS